MHVWTISTAFTVSIFNKCLSAELEQNEEKSLWNMLLTLTAWLLYCRTSDCQQLLCPILNKKSLEFERRYQQQDGEEAIEDVVPVGQVSLPAKCKDLHTHLKQVVQDEAQVDDLKVREEHQFTAVSLSRKTYRFRKFEAFWENSTNTFSQKCNSYYLKEAISKTLISKISLWPLTHWWKFCSVSGVTNLVSGQGSLKNAVLG